MKDSGIRPMKGIFWPTNALQYQSETKRKKRVFSQYTKKKKKKERSPLVLFSFLLIWECFPLIGYSTYSNRQRARIYYQSKDSLDLTKQHNYCRYTTSLGLPFHLNHGDIYSRYRKRDSCEDRGNERLQSHLFQNKTKTKWMSSKIMVTSSKRQACCLWQNKPTNKQTKQKTKRANTQAEQNSI